jgi:hypothetical protein
MRHEDITKVINALTKIELSLFIAAQWAKSKQAREEAILKSLSGSTTSDEELKNLIILGAQRLFRQRWSWIESKKYNLPLSIYPVVPYDRMKIDDKNNRTENVLTSILNSKVTLFPYNKEILIIITDDKLDKYFTECLDRPNLTDVYGYANTLYLANHLSKDHYYIDKLVGHTMNIKLLNENPELIRIDEFFFAQYTLITTLNQKTFFVISDEKWKNKIKMPNEVSTEIGFNNKDYYTVYLKETKQIPKNDYVDFDNPYPPRMFYIRDY